MSVIQNSELQIADRWQWQTSFSDSSLVCLSLLEFICHEHYVLYALLLHVDNSNYQCIYDIVSCEDHFGLWWLGAAAVRDCGRTVE